MQFYVINNKEMLIENFILRDLFEGSLPNCFFTLTLITNWLKELAELLYTAILLRVSGFSHAKEDTGGLL